MSEQILMFISALWPFWAFGLLVSLLASIMMQGDGYEFSGCIAVFLVFVFAGLLTVSLFVNLTVLVVETRYQLN